MILTARTPPEGQPVRFPWRCACGARRLILIAHVRHDRPFNTTGRPAGACKSCGRDASYRIERTSSGYRAIVTGKE